MAWKANAKPQQKILEDFGKNLKNAFSEENMTKTKISDETGQIAITYSTLNIAVKLAKVISVVSSTNRQIDDTTLEDVTTFMTEFHKKYGAPREKPPKNKMFKTLAEHYSEHHVAISNTINKLREGTSKTKAKGGTPQPSGDNIREPTWNEDKENKAQRQKQPCIKCQEKDIAILNLNSQLEERKEQENKSKPQNKKKEQVAESVTNKELQEKIQNLQRRYEESQEKCDQKDREIDDLKRRLEVAETQLSDEKTCSLMENSNHQRQLEGKDRQLRQLREEIKKVEKEARNSVLDELSLNMEKKIAENEEDFENISRANRPMKIKDEYQHLFSNQWLNAKAELDSSKDFSGMPENTKLLYLLILLENTYKACDEQKQEKINAAMKMPDKKNEPELAIQQYVRDEAELTEKDKKAIHQKIVPKDISRDIEMEAKRALNNDEKKMVNKLKKTPAAVKIYIEECIQVCWRMVTQIPPMTLTYDGIGGKYQGESVQELQWGSDPPDLEDNVVLFYVQPPLKHGQHVMTKGKVICGPRSA